MREGSRTTHLPPTPSCSISDDMGCEERRIFPVPDVVPRVASKALLPCFQQRLLPTECLPRSSLLSDLLSSYPSELPPSPLHILLNAFGPARGAWD